jgi:hypothetical protein
MIDFPLDAFCCWKVQVKQVLVLKVKQTKTPQLLVQEAITKKKPHHPLNPKRNSKHNLLVVVMLRDSAATTSKQKS